MSLKIRLKEQGRKNLAAFRLVLTDSRSKRDGKYLENLGWYNPTIKQEDKQLELHGDRIAYWLNLGAIPSEQALSLMERSCPEVFANYRAKLLAKATKKRAAARARRKG